MRRKCGTETIGKKQEFMCSKRMNHKVHVKRWYTEMYDGIPKHGKKLWYGFFFEARNPYLADFNSVDKIIVC